MNKEEARAAVLALPRWADGKIREVPGELRAQLLELAEASPEPKNRFARSVGLSASVLSSWSKRGREKAVGKFKPMRVVRSAPAEISRWEVRGPLGIRVSGMTISELVELFCRLEGR